MSRNKLPHVVDDLKPSLPYTSGTVVEVKQHTPPPPFGPGYRAPYRHHLISDHWEVYDTPSRCCLDNPPPDTPPHPAQQMRSLKIIDQVACSDGRGPQIVTCYFVGHEANLLVAKFYDPLYYDWWDYDPTYLADQDYSREAAAISRLSLVNEAERMGYPGVREALEGSIPTYHGCWTWRTSLLNGQHRDVRMILMDHISFPTMKSLIDSGDVEKIPVELRIDLFAKALEVYCWALFFGVDQRDLYPRNILVGVDQKQVVILDFSIARVRDLPNSNWTSSNGEPGGRPKSPIEVLGGSLGVWYVDSWLPSDLEYEEAQHAWFKKTWGESKVFAPVSDKVAQALGMGNSRRGAV